MQLNKHYTELNESYLFSTIARKVREYQAAHPEADVIRLGIGDVTLPLPAPVIEALHGAVAEMGVQETFHGYIPSEQGYPFLRDAIRGYYAERGVKISSDEIFISDGAKSDLGNLLDCFAADNTVLVPDPVYPVYVDDNVMAGRSIVYMAANAGNDFLPMPPADGAGAAADIVYLCSPNNPTGAAYTPAQLKCWVDWAIDHEAVILYDAAYECFVTEPGPARTIYEVPGAEQCAVEVCSFSKMAGFTGTRCGWTVVPMGIESEDPEDGVHQNLNKMWLRRQTTKFNGVAYIIQRGAAAVFTPEGRAAIEENLAYYRRNAAVIAAALDEAGVWYCGGKNSPYIWLRCPAGMDSWQFFDWLLDTAHVVGTPGAGFGPCGEGYFRLTAFGDAERTKQAAGRLQRALAKL